MTRLEVVNYVRRITRDLTASIFREQDIVDFINDGIDRVRQVIPELKGMKHLLAPNQRLTLLPNEYHRLIGIFAASRCFFQDEKAYQATTLMNEFEVKLEELKNAIESGDVVIVDEDGSEVEDDGAIEYVDLSAYWGVGREEDLGVEGLK